MKPLGVFLKLQCVVFIYALASVCSKLAARHLPAKKGGLATFLADCARSPGLVGFTLLMVFLLAVYAYCWQKIIRCVKISAAYANKGICLFWAQIAAVALFGEHLTKGNCIGVAIVFLGVLIANLEPHES